MRVLMASLIAVFSAVAVAGGTTTYSLELATVAAGVPATLRIDSTDGCFLAESHTVSRAGSEVEVRIVQTDELPCLPSQLTPIRYSLGTFDAGTYAVRVVVCVNAPDPCNVRSSLTLQVTEASGTRFTVPALSPWGLIVLGVGALIAGSAWRRKRPG